MRRASRWGWWMFFGGAALVLAALAWASAAVLSLEGREHRGRLQRSHVTTMRLALWRMDSWLAPLIATEAARPYYEYEPYFGQAEAYTKLLSKIQAGEVLTPSPLLSLDSDWIQLHFQVGPDAAWTSPQVPTGNLRDLAESSGFDAREIDRAEGLLASLSGSIHGNQLRSAACIAEVQLADSLSGDGAAADPVAQAGDEAWQKRELDLRMQNTYRAPEQQKAQSGALPTGETPSAGSLAPLWVMSSSGPQLCLVRTVQVGRQQWLQGCWVDWSVLQAQLLDQVSDLFASAALTPKLNDDPPDLERALGGLPAYLDVEPAPFDGPRGLTPVRASLAGTWIAALLAIVAVGMSLRTAIIFGEKSHRFASAVTHELRTPLTTFQMYSEMLAKDMVRDEARRREYLETLEGESHRLSHLVENVLTYARLEDGRGALRIEDTSWGSLAARILPALERRAAEGGMRWSTQLDVADDDVLRTDPEALRQILFNLVDNACKYGSGGADDAVELRVREEATGWTFVVRDQGHGVPRQVRDRIFTPFDRGGRDPADKNPGIGLGLALARGLARDLGGDLHLVEGEGAVFELTLPRAS